jgi:hypothetical protein
MTPNSFVRVGTELTIRFEVLDNMERSKVVELSDFSYLQPNLDKQMPATSSLPLHIPMPVPAMSSVVPMSSLLLLQYADDLDKAGTMKAFLHLSSFDLFYSFLSTTITIK